MIPRSRVAAILAVDLVEVTPGMAGYYNLGDMDHLNYAAAVLVG